MRLFEGTPWDRPPACERCGNLVAECQCPPPPPAYLAPQKQTARVQVEKRKAGRMMTVVRGLAPASNDLPTLLTQLKNACGAGGTIKDDTLEIQGDQRERVSETLKRIGYKVK
jgi:translation initiation factor 1